MLDVYRAETHVEPAEAEPVTSCDSFFADDVVTAVKHARREELCREPWDEGRDVKKALNANGLDSPNDKSANLLASPGETNAGFFGRAPDAEGLPCISNGTEGQGHLSPTGDGSLQL